MVNHYIINNSWVRPAQAESSFSVGPQDLRTAITSSTWLLDAVMTSFADASLKDIHQKTTTCRGEFYYIQ